MAAVLRRSRLTRTPSTAPLDCCKCALVSDIVTQVRRARCSHPPRFPPGELRPLRLCRAPRAAQAPLRTPADSGRPTGPMAQKFRRVFVSIRLALFWQQLRASASRPHWASLPRVHQMHLSGAAHATPQVCRWVTAEPPPARGGRPCATAPLRAVPTPQAPDPLPAAAQSPRLGRPCHNHHPRSALPLNEAHSLPNTGPRPRFVAVHANRRQRPVIVQHQQWTCRALQKRRKNSSSFAAVSPSKPLASLVIPR